MAWFELDPDTAHAPILHEHLTSEEQERLHGNWDQEQQLAGELRDAGIPSGDEFAAHKRRRVAESVGVLVPLAS